MIEVYVGKQAAAERSAVIECASKAGGILAYEETGEEGDVQKGACLTFEFESKRHAQEAVEGLSSKGIHVEGPCDY